MRKYFLSALTILISFSTMAEKGDIQNECALRASTLSDIVGLYKDPIRQCSKIQVKQFIHEVATGGAQTHNNCIPQNRYKIPDDVDGKRFEVWANSLVESVWSNTLKDPGNYEDFTKACMNNPDKFIGGQWLYK